MKYLILLMVLLSASVSSAEDQVRLYDCEKEQTLIVATDEDTGMSIAFTGGALFFYTDMFKTAKGLDVLRFITHSKRYSLGYAPKTHEMAVVDNETSEILMSVKCKILKKGA